MPWNIATLKYTGKFKDVSAEDIEPVGLFLSPDGLNLYIIGDDTNIVYQYLLSSPEDVDTAVYTGKFKDVAAEATVPTGLTFSDDGLNMYITSNDTNKVFQYSLITPWDVDTAVYTGKFKDVAAEDIVPTGLTFSDDGFNMYIVGNSTDTVYQYLLTTPWDVDTAVYTGKFKDVAAQEIEPQSVAFGNNGANMYILGFDQDSIFQYSLTTPWDVDTAIYTNRVESIASEETGPRSVAIYSEGQGLIIVGTSQMTVFQYEMQADQSAVTINIIEKLIVRLLPTGRAWRQITGIKVVTDFLGGIADALEEIKAAAEKVRDSIFPELMDVEFISDWEQRFKLSAIANGTEQERRDRLAAQWQNRGGMTRGFLETQLQESGFNVFVYEGLYIAEGAVLDDVILGDAVLEGNAVPGEILAINPCDQFAGNVGTLGDYVLGDGDTLGVNRPRIIQNYIDESLENTDFCPLDPGRYNFVIYIGGPGGIGDIADIPASRYLEFRQTVLKYKRGTAWALAFVNLI